MQFPSRHTNINMMESQKGDLVLRSKSAHVFPCLSPIALGTWTPMSHLRVTPMSRLIWLFIKWMVEFSVVGFFPKICLVDSAKQRDTAQPHRRSSRPWRRNGNTSHSVQERRICHSAASSLSEHSRLIMKLHFEQLQNLLAGQTRGALPRKRENTEGKDISGCALKKQQSTTMFWERELWLIQQGRSYYWQEGLGCFFILPQKNTWIWVLPCPHCSIYPGYKRELKGTVPSEDQW